jgi:hypothetical protein
MPRANLNCDPLPETDDGYLCRVTDCVESKNKGRIVWVMSFRVLAGAFAGRDLEDRLWWTENGKKRCHLVLSRFGILREGEQDYEADEIVGKDIILFPEIEVYNEEARNKIPFDGYKAVEGIPEPPPLGEPDIPPF